LVTLYGYGFTANSTYTVYWSSTTSLTTGTVSATGTISIYFAVPTYTYIYTRGSYPITVTTSAGDTSNAVYFTIIPQVVLSTSSGYVGAQITVTGSGFYPSSSVTIYFDSTAVVTTTTTSSGTFSSVINIPSSYRGAHSVTANDGYGASSAITFTILPKVTITPTLAAVGDQITISGTGFAASQSVTIYFDDTSTSSATTDSLGTVSQTSFTVPASAWGSHTIRIQDASGNYATATFSTKQGITLTPTSGPIGTMVTVSGKGFNANTGITITLDDVPVTTTTVITDTDGSFSTTLNIPASSGGAHQIKASDGTNIDTKTFTITATITVNPTSGYVGTKVTVNGAGFLGSATVSITFNNVSVKTVLTNTNGSFSTNFDVPAQGAGTYKIRATDGANTKDTDFTVTTSATISPATSTTSPGYVGMAITVTGVGFMPGRPVTITYDGKQVTTSVVGSDGGFTATFNVPASQSGARTVTASDGTNSIPMTFVMEATPPSVPALLTPESGTKTKSLATFQWSAVTDPSGVTYTLQIATDAGFTKIVLAKSELTQSEYTLTKDEKLSSVSKDTPYYWRVKAVDGASNESAWSSAGSFYVGFNFTIQALIYIIIGIVAVILILLAFWVGTRRSTRLE
jgi:hypothetical protein